ncbi:hypothetical protein GOV11_02055 [Candidatus Woesearchaeota archaeon]|nr:hypothetical protein [Candidatus Woesearchaeota archaeon]
MERLDIVHHKFIGLLLALIVLVIGILFGVRINGDAGVTGLYTLTFGLVFLVVVLQFVMFTQLVHIRDDIRRKKK